MESLRKSFDVSASKLGLITTGSVFAEPARFLPKVFTNTSSLNRLHPLLGSKTAPILTLNLVSRFKVESVGLVFSLI